jgi:hypothetical protein
MSSITTLEEATQAVWQAIETGDLSAVTAALAVWTGLKADAAAAAKVTKYRQWIAAFSAVGVCCPDDPGCDCALSVAKHERMDEASEAHDAAGIAAEDARLYAKEWSDAAELEARISRGGSAASWWCPLNHCMRVWRKVGELACYEMDEALGGSGPARFHRARAAPRTADFAFEAEVEADLVQKEKEAKGWFKAYEAATAAAQMAVREGLWPTAAS